MNKPKAKDRFQCPIRMNKADHEKVTELASEYGLSFQKIAEVLILNFIHGNKPVVAVIERYAEEKKSRKGRTFDQTERSDILEQIKQVSPIRNL
jgi:hypothetical protein